MADTANEQAVRRFFELWEEGFDSVAAAYQEYMTGDCLWWNSGFPDCHGPEESLALQAHVRDEMGVH